MSYFQIEENNNMSTIEEIKLQKTLIEQTLTQETETVKNELSKIDSLQYKVREMQLQLQALNKVEISCDKKYKEGVQSTILTIRNKLNLSQSQSLARLRQQKVRNYVDCQKSKVKEIRQKEANELQTAKRENQKVKEDMMKEIREISMKNEQVIKRTKQLILQKNKLKASCIKNDKQNYKQSLMQSKIKEMKEKHEQQMRKSRIRMQKRAQLEKKYEQLLKEKETIESRVLEKKQFNNRLQSLKNNIGKMQNDEIQETISDLKKKISKYETQKLKTQKISVQELEKDEEYVKYKLFEKYFQAEQVRREQRENIIY